MNNGGDQVFRADQERTGRMVVMESGCRSATGSALSEAAASLTFLVPSAILLMFLILMSGAYVLYSQKINFAAQSGAVFAAQLVGPPSFFLGVANPAPTSPATTMAADAPLIRAKVQQTLQAFAVPGGATAVVIPSVVTTGGVLMAQVTVSVASFRLPGLPSTVPAFSLLPVTAAFPFSQPAQLPPAFLQLNTFQASSGGGNFRVTSTLFPAYAAGTAAPSGSSPHTIDISNKVVGVPVSPCGITLTLMEPD